MPSPAPTKDEFIIDSSSGALTFANTPDYEAPTDADTNNVYQVTLEVSDGNGNNASQELTISVTDGNENTHYYIRNQCQHSRKHQRHYLHRQRHRPGRRHPDICSLQHRQKTIFTIDSSSGTISFTINPDYENPADADNRQRLPGNP